MVNIQTLNRIHEAVVWGAIFVWWGIAELFKLPNGMDALGIGLILLGLTSIRWLNGLPTNGFTITIGLLALIWGGLDLSRSVAHVPLELEAEFALLLIALGVIIVVLGLARVRRLSS